MSNNQQSSVVETAIKQIYQRILDSKNPNTLTKRDGDYRIGLQEAINILEDLKPTNNKETELDISELVHKAYPFSNNETRNAFITGYNKGKEMESHRFTERFEEGRELGQIEILAQQSTSNASSYTDGYKEGYKRALQLVQVKVNEKIKELKGKRQ